MTKINFPSVVDLVLQLSSKEKREREREREMPGEGKHDNPHLILIEPVLSIKL